jgi:mannose/fructose-specific phosphotransferase system component IIA
MKMHRLIAGLALAIVLLLAACRPADQGGGSSATPSQAAESAAPSAAETAEPSESESESEAATPSPYEY